MRERGGRLPILTGGTGLYFASLTDGLAAIPDPGPAARAEARQLAEGTRPGRPARPPCRGRPGHRRPAPPHRQPAHRPRLGGVARHRHRPRRLADRPPAQPAPVALHRHPARPAARRTARRHRHPLRRHAGGRCAWTRCAPCWRCTSIRHCRRCARTACRNLPPICAANSPWSRPYSRIELVTGQYTKRQATWFRHHPLAAPAARIQSMRESHDLEQFSERNYPEILDIY